MTTSTSPYPPGRSDLFSWFSRYRPRQNSYLPVSFASRSPSPQSSGASSAAGSPPPLDRLSLYSRNLLTLTLNPFNARRRASAHAALNVFARRRAVQLALTLALPIFAILLLAELHTQRVQYATLGAELLARDVAALPDPTGHVNLTAWRERRPPSYQQDLELWPSWWGNVDEVGPSPFDHIPPPLSGKKRRVLFLTDYTDYLERMNTHTYEIVDAALRHENVIVDVWGPGWEGYDWTVPLSINVKRRANRVSVVKTLKHEHEEMLKQRQEELERKERFEKSREAYQDFLSAEEADAAQAAEEQEVPAPPFVLPSWTSFDDRCNPAVRYDVVWTISDIYKPHHKDHLDALDCGALLVQQLGDCHEHRCLKEWYPYSNNITLSKYAFELPELFNYDNVRNLYPGFEMGLFGHSPDTGNPWDFYPLPWDKRTAKAVVFGFDGGLYPIRTTVTNRLNDNNPDLPPTPISRHPHPGYTVHTSEEWKTHPLETYTPGHETYAAHRSLREDFARGMRTAQICVFDASVERKLIRKYAQALLSGCVVAADLPTEHEEALGNFVIKLHPRWDINRIEEEINKHLADPQRLQQMALDGFAYARQHLSTSGKISDVLRMADAHNAGARGYDFAYSFSSRCRSYVGDAPPPPWCSGSEYRGLEDRV